MNAPHAVHLFSTACVESECGRQKLQHNIRQKIFCQTSKNELSPKREYFALGHKIIPAHELTKWNSSASKGHYKQ